MRAYQGGRLEAFDDLYAALAPPLGRYLRSHARDAAKADDLLQDTFLQIHRARHTYDPAFPVLPWAMAIARHVWLMDCRTAARRPKPAGDALALDLPVRGEAAAYAERTDVRRALAHVSPAKRAALVGHHVYGWSFKEIAARAGLPGAAGVGGRPAGTRCRADGRRRLAHVLPLQRARARAVGAPGRGSGVGGGGGHAVYPAKAGHHILRAMRLKPDTTLLDLKVSSGTRVPRTSRRRRE